MTNEQVSRLEEIREEMVELLGEAKQIVSASSSSTTRERAKGYWLAQLTMSDFDLIRHTLRLLALIRDDPVANGAVIDLVEGAKVREAVNLAPTTSRQLDEALAACERVLPSEPTLERIKGVQPAAK